MIQVKIIFYDMHDEVSTHSSVVMCVDMLFQKSEIRGSIPGKAGLAGSEASLKKERQYSLG